MVSIKWNFKPSCTNEVVVVVLVGRQRWQVIWDWSNSLQALTLISHKESKRQQYTTYWTAQWRRMDILIFNFFVYMLEKITPTQIESERSDQCRVWSFRNTSSSFLFRFRVHTNQLFDVMHWKTSYKWIMMSARGMSKSYSSICRESIRDDNSNRE